MRPPKITRGADINAQLRAAYDMLSRSEVERAWTAADAATKELGTGSLALRAEVAARLLATIITDVSAQIETADDLAAALPTVQGLATYTIGRVATIATAGKDGAA